MIEAAHGRAPAVATAVKRALPTASCSPTRATATWRPSVRPRRFMRPRGENITRRIREQRYHGMTGGQMVSTSLPNQVTRPLPTAATPRRPASPSAWRA